MRRPLLLCLIVIMLVAGAVVVGAASAAPLHPCASASVECGGTVTVPLDWADPASERIEVAFLRIPRRDVAAPSTGTVLVHMGGPSPSILSTGKVVDHLGQALEHQDLVLADLRGMGKSAPLGCTGLDIDEPATTAACIAQLGPRAAFFNTQQAAHDYDAVRAALGVQRWTLFGNSYGTELVQAYAAAFPQHVTAVLLSGVVPTSGDGYFSPGGPYEAVRASIRAMQNACVASSTCRDLPGTAAERLTAVVTALRSTVPTDVPKLVTVLEESVFEAGPRRDFNAALDAFLHSDEAPLRRLLDAVTPRPNRPALPPDRSIAIIGYGCNDGTLPYDRSAPVEVRRAQLADFYVREQPFAPFTPAEGNAGSSIGMNPAEFCLESPLLHSAPPVDLHAAHPDVPVLEIQGTGDVLTALEHGAVAARFPHGTYVDVPYGRHGSWTAEHPTAGFCQRDMMREFLTAPRIPAVDHHCDLTVYQLHGRFPRTEAALPHAELSHLAAAFAAAADAITPLYPTDVPAPAAYEQRGLRGGTATLKDGVVTLAEVRYVEDVTVDGTVTIDANHQGTASLTASGHHLVLHWAMLDPAPVTVVSGTKDGRPFTARLPGF